MQINSTRKSAEMNEVMYKFPYTSDPVYWVFGGMPSDKWENMTILNPNPQDEEPSKTYGHYHGVNVDETYKLIQGEGVFLLQKKHIENGVWMHNQVDKVYWVIFKPGDEIVITPEWGHSWSNIGNTPLITFDNWRSGHSPDDYKYIQELKGMAYYLVRKNGTITAEKNPNYKNTPEATYISAQDFNKLK